MFNESISKGIFLDEWKISIIDPIFKSGSKNLVSNYRAITKLSVVPKILDSLVQNKFNLIIKQQVSVNQHGFWKDRSTSSNLVEFTNFCTKAMDIKKQVHVVYTDFVKAFSKVNLQILLAKLEAYGFHGPLLQWFSSYLLGRKQYVRIGDFYSKEIKAISGVPEGSHLGPSLFLLFINDLPNCIKNSRCLLYADDIKFFSTISTINDSQFLQNDLDNFVNWCKLNKLLLNIDKCVCMAYNRTLFNIVPNYTLNNSPLKVVDHFKDLGVIFDSKLNFNLHINYIVSKASSLLGFVKRNSVDFKDPYTIKSLFCSIVRPILEYNCVVWNSTTDTNRKRIENVQKKFIKFALRGIFENNINYNNPSYKSKCLLLGMQSLEARRNVYSIMFVRDILSGAIDSENLLCCVHLYAPSTSLRARPLLAIDAYRTLHGQRNPISASCILFNVYYENIDISLPRNLFKNILNSLLVE